MMISLAAAVALMAAPPANIRIERLYAVMKPWDVPIPPAAWRSTAGRIDVLYAADPREHCTSSPGFIIAGCTRWFGTRRRSVLPDPRYFPDESFARALVTMTITDRNEAIRARSCSFPRQVFARLACHEVIGHLLAGWPADHPER